MYELDISSDSSDTTIISPLDKTSKDHAPNFYDLTSLEEESLDSNDPIVEKFSQVDSSHALQQIRDKYLGSDSSSSCLSNGKFPRKNSSNASSSGGNAHTTVKSPGDETHSPVEKPKMNLPENKDKNEYDINLKDLANKYLMPSSSGNCDLSKKQSSSLSSCSQNGNNLNTFNDIDKFFDLTQADEEPETSIKKRKVITGKNNTTEERNRKKQMLEQEKLAKKLERERKKQEMEEEKELKRLRAKVQKDTKREQCLKNIMVKLDESVCSENYGEAIKLILQENVVGYETIPHTQKGLIYWTRKSQTIAGMNLKVTYCDEKHYLVILPFREFITLCQQNELIDYIGSLLSKLNFKHITIIVYGNQKPTQEQEQSIINVEMSYKCYWKFEKRSDGLAKAVMALTKAVAHIPYKEEKKQKYKIQNEFLSDSNKDTVNIDKNGNGLRRLWHQMLTMFPLARLETAEAITAVYPTPASLFKAYEENNGNNDELLQDLPIRRAHGPLTTVRRIGPELSKKCSNFFNLIDDDYM